MERVQIENYVGSKLILKKMDNNTGRVFKRGEIENTIKEIFSNFGMEVDPSKYSYFTDQIYDYEELLEEALSDLQRPYVFNDLSEKARVNARADKASANVLNWCKNLSERISSEIVVEMEKRNITTIQQETKKEENTIIEENSNKEIVEQPIEEKKEQVEKSIDFETLDRTQIENYVGNKLYTSFGYKNAGRTFKRGEIENTIKEIFSNFGIEVDSSKYSYFTDQIYDYQELLVEAMDDLQRPYIFNDLSEKARVNARADKAGMNINKWCKNLGERISSEIVVEMEKRKDNGNLQQFQEARERQMKQDQAVRAQQLTGLTEEMVETKEGHSLK